MKICDKNNAPIPLTYENGKIGKITFGYLHYGDSALISKLQTWSYIEIVAIGLFIFLGFSGFSFIVTMKKTYMGWNGKGDCASIRYTCFSFMGWVQWIKEHPNKTHEIIPEIEVDLQRLEQINRRFSEMGNESVFEEFDLSLRIEKIINYLRKRLPSLGKRVKLANDIQPGIVIKGNGVVVSLVD